MPPRRANAKASFRALLELSGAGLLGFHAGHLCGRSGIVAKWLGDEAIKPEFLRVAEDRQPDRHALVPRLRLRAVRAEQAIPPGKIEPEIAVGLMPQHRVVHAMHVGR